MSYRVENRNSLGRIVGYAGFKDSSRVAQHIWSVMEYARSQPWNQIRTIAVYRDGEFQYARTV